jgi:aerobic-type carbon monoxide dehydrogenase small subunit (CoxS/CutS family)
MSKNGDNKTGGVSRRSFLKGMGSGIVSTTATVAGAGLLPEETVAAILEPDLERVTGAKSIRLKVNGKSYSVTVEPRTTLLSALRDKLDLTGTKEVCDRGQCGGCTVMIDGKIMLSCLMLALDAEGKEVTTVEGLADGDELSAIQEAFVEKDGLMCGFCTPGFVVSATALLKENGSPSLDDIKHGLSGNICRCGTYPKVFEAVEAAAKNSRKGG